MTSLDVVYQQIGRQCTLNYAAVGSVIGRLKPKNCTKGWSCGYTCLPKTKKNCKAPMEGQAKTYADWLSKQVKSADPKPKTDPVTPQSQGKTKGKTDTKAEPSNKKSRADEPVPYYTGAKLDSYEKFADQVERQVDRFNDSFNTDGLISIPSLKESLRSATPDESQVNKWLLQMQKDRRLQLLEEEPPNDGSARWQKEPVVTPLGKPRYFMKIGENRRTEPLPPAVDRIKPTAKQLKDFENSVKKIVDDLARENSNYNRTLTPVYRIRRAIAGGMSREEFNAYMFELQSKKGYRLLEESVEDSSPDKIRDSLTTKAGKLRAYFQFPEGDR